MCCIALALLVASLRNVASLVVPRLRHHEPTRLPPAARRAYGHETAAPNGTPVPSAPGDSVDPRGPRTRLRRRSARDGRDGLGRLLIIGGLGWFAAGIVLMHGFGVVPGSIHASVGLDLVFHGSGPLVASVGLVVRAPTVRRAPVRQARTGRAA